jgi:nitrate reductase gamma subunit
MYDFLIGPMLAVSLVVFVAGVAYRIRQFFSLSEEVKIDLSALPKDIAEAVKKREKDEYLKVDSVKDVLLKWKLRLKRNFLGKYPVFSAITIVFHLLIVFLPLVTVGHNILLNEYLGFSLPALSEAAVDKLTILFIVLFFFFLMRRVMSERVSAVSTYRDYIALFATGAPFITGYMAYHQMFNYDTILYIHIICGELMLIAIPFTKLVHMPFFILSRFLIRYELSFGSGSRKWVENS